MTGIKDVIETLDKAADGFGSTVSKTQKKLYEDVLVLVKELDLDAQGKVRPSVANFKRLTTIKTKLSHLAKETEYSAGIGKFLHYFDVLQQEQNAYFTGAFPQSTVSTTAAEKHKLMKQIAVQNTIDALTGTGLKANVTDKINDILLRAVTSGAKFADLTGELKGFLQGENGSQGALSRYATTYATTALSQFTGQNNKLLTQDLGAEWFMYVGSTKETTREFCEHLVEKRYIHISEIPTILKGEIDGHQCKIYDKTGLPLGMIEGTNAENFQVNCGGWNCRHQLVPVDELAVPQDVRDKIKNTYKQIKPTVETKEQKEKRDVVIEAIAPYADIYGVDVTRLKTPPIVNGEWSQSYFEEAVRDINRAIRVNMRKKENKEIVPKLIENGYEDIKTNTNGGLYAKHPKHAKHENDKVVYFEGLNGDALEEECANSVFETGHRIILREEGIVKDGNPLRELDAIIDGNLMDIASITKNGAHTLRNVLKNKINQLGVFNEQHSTSANSLCIYFHNPSWYNRDNLIAQYKECIRWAKLEEGILKHIYIVLNGHEDIIKIDI